jgi:L-amino acid N-acyltransferase YncA
MRCGHPYGLRLAVRVPYGGPVPTARIRPLTRDDWPEVVRIYAEGLATGLASFETQVPSWDEWDAGHRDAPRLVAELGVVAGWLAVAPVSGRACYTGVVEHSVYVDASHHGIGVGRTLLERLIAAAPDHGIWTIQTSIIAANDASLALHAAVGFRTVGRRERIAQRDGVWHDTVLLELRLP